MEGGRERREGGRDGWEAGRDVMAIIINVMKWVHNREPERRRVTSY